MSGGSHGSSGGGSGGSFSLSGIAAVAGVIFVGFIGFKNLNLLAPSSMFGQAMPSTNSLEQGPFIAYPGKEFQILGVPNYCMSRALNGDKLVNLNTEPRNRRYVFRYKLRPEVKEPIPVTFVLDRKGTNGCNS